MCGPVFFLLRSNDVIGLSNKIGHLTAAVSQVQRLELVGLRFIIRPEQSFLEHALDLWPVPTDHAEVIRRNDQHSRGT